MPLLENVVFQQKNPMITQDLSRRSIATSGESVPTYPRRPKAEVFSNAVDVVERLCDLIDPSTERMTPPHSAHVQLDDIPRTPIQPSVEGEFHQHEGVATVMIKLLMTHKYRGSIVVLSISKSVEPNKEQKEMISGFQQNYHDVFYV